MVIMVLLRALAFDRLMQNDWSKVQNIDTVQLIINEQVCTSDFNLTFGDLDSVYMQLLAKADLNSSGNYYLKIL